MQTTIYRNKITRKKKSDDLLNFLDQLFTGSGYLQKNYVEYILDQRLKQIVELLKICSTSDLKDMDYYLDDYIRFRKLRTEVESMNSKIYAY